jgi:aryl-alcohol dehydrogenase-like predicted oxidoreductase
MIQACKALGVAFIPFSPLARGMMGDSPLPAPTDGFRAVNPRFMEPNFTANTLKINEFRAFCAARGWPTPATAIAWVLSRGDHLIPIPGTRSANHLRQIAQGAALTLKAEDLAEIDRILPPGFAYGDRYGDHQVQAIERYC